MTLDITILVKDARWKPLLKPHVKTVHAACEAAAQNMRSRKELTVVLANDALARKLNRDFRGMDKPTNVLSFPGGGAHLGDIVLARQTVAREAKAQGKTLRAHAVHLLVHGVLHLLGYDHLREKDARNMERREIKVLKKLGISNPYL